MFIMLKYASVVLVAVWLHAGHARQISPESLNDDTNNEIGKPTSDWVRISQAPPLTVNRMAGSPIELECEAIGSPAPTLQWLKGDRPMSDDSIAFQSNILNELPTRGMAKVRARLFIRLAGPEHRGVYKCLAESGSQVATASSEVIVAGETTFGNELLAAPKITLYDTIYLDNIGSDIVLPCKVSGSPRPSVIWLDPSEQVVGNDPRLKVLPSGELRIRNIRWSDMGPYVCVARNSVGQDNVMTFLYPMLAEK